MAWNKISKPSSFEVKRCLAIKKKTAKKYYIIDVTTNDPHTAKALQNKKTSKHLDALLRDDGYI